MYASGFTTRQGVIPSSRARRCYRSLKITIPPYASAVDNGAHPARQHVDARQPRQIQSPRGAVQSAREVLQRRGTLRGKNR